MAVTQFIMPARPSAQPACAHVVHQVSPRHRVVRLAPVADRFYGTSGSTEWTVAGKDKPMINVQLTGGVRGVPPRGRPV